MSPLAGLIARRAWSVVLVMRLVRSIGADNKENGSAAKERTFAARAIRPRPSCLPFCCSYRLLRTVVHKSDEQSLKISVAYCNYNRFKAADGGLRWPFEHRTVHRLVQSLAHATSFVQCRGQRQYPSLSPLGHGTRAAFFPGVCSVFQRPHWPLCGQRRRLRPPQKVSAVQFGDDVQRQPGAGETGAAYLSIAASSG